MRPPALGAAAAALCFAGVASAQAPQGWSPRASVGGTASFTDDRSVVGLLDGPSFSLGLKIDAGLDLDRGRHEWRNALGALVSVTRTPVIDDFVKTADDLGLDSTYLFHVVPWFGAYARVSAATAMFRGTDMRARPVTYSVTHTDGTVVHVPNADEMTLTDPFRPFTLKHSAGAFVQYRTAPLTAELRAGAGVQEVFADGQLALAPVQPAAGAGGVVGEVDLVQLRSASQGGSEVAVALWGAVLDRRVTYKLDADAMTPLAHTALPAGDTRGAFQLTNLQVDGSVSFHLATWASLGYQLRVLRQPQILDTFQVQNTVRLTFGLVVPGREAAALAGSAAAAR